MADHKYHLTYEATAQPEGLAKVDIPEGAGACDAMVLMSLIFPEDGSYSWDLVTPDGRNDGELDGDEIWKAWLMLTKHLSIRQDMRPGKADICRNIFAQVQSLLTTTDKKDLH